MSEHTPGPWQVCDGREHGVETLNGEWICDCIETPANAKIIAAAPYLLAACKKLMDRVIDGSTTVYEINSLQDTESTFEAIEAAIKKATE